MTVNDRVKKWYRLHRAEEVKKRGGRCLFCSSEERLEFAHVKDTPLSKIRKGRGRSQEEVLKDMRLNPTSYVLLCERCHDDYDYDALEKSTRESLEMQ